MSPKTAVRRITRSGRRGPGTDAEDLAILGAGLSAVIQLEDISVTVPKTRATTTLDGSGNLTTGALDADFTLNDLQWQTGDTVPSDGTVDVASGGLAATITFLPTTPVDCIVHVAIVGIPEFDYTLGGFCGGSE